MGRGVDGPLVASRTERIILHDMGHEAGDSRILDEPLDAAERLAAAAEEGRVDLGDLGRRAPPARVDGEADRVRAAVLSRLERTFFERDRAGDRPLPLS